MRILGPVTKIIVFGISLALLAGSAYANVFQEGKITQIIKGKNRPTVEIDNVKYLMLPHVQVYQIVKNEKSDSWDMQPVQRTKLKNGSKVYYKVEEDGISELYIKR